MARRFLSRPLFKSALKLTLALGIGLLLTEGTVRFLLFTDIPFVASLGAKLRQPGLYTDQREDDYWKLMQLFTGARSEPRFYDERLGWRSAPVVPETYEHAEADQLDGRRPVLLYGDSYAECMTSPEECWQGLLERSELGRTHKLLNYGSGGYGVDQTLLAYQHSIERYAALDPLVIFSIFVDSDVDRCMLSFRGWPKPYFRIEGDAVELVGDVPRGFDAYMEGEPIGFPSYAWRYALFGLDVVDKARRDRLVGLDDYRDRARTIMRSILEDFWGDVKARDLDAFVLLFHKKRHLSAKVGETWQDDVLVSLLESLDIPYMSSKYPLQRDLLSERRRPASYYILEGPGNNHFTPLGNEVVFETIERGIAGKFDSKFSNLFWAEREHLKLGGPPAFARYESWAYPPYKAEEDLERLVFSASSEGPTVLSYTLHREAKSFRGVLKRTPLPPSIPSSQRVEVLIRCDEEVRVREMLGRDAEPIDLDLDLTGVNRLSFVVADGEDGREGDFVYIASPAVR